MSILVQSDFDGTITEEDVSFVLLEDFAQGDWRRLLREYREGRISVLDLNTGAFAMIKDDRDTLVKSLKGKVRVRPGFRELVDYCRRRGFEFVIVSNGLDFYIDAILEELGLGDIEVHAARAHFHPEGITACYVGPHGEDVDEGFKEAYIRSFLKTGCTVVYMGNGVSDIVPAQQAHYVFATGELLAHCSQKNLDCRPLVSFTEVTPELERISQLQV